MKKIILSITLALALLLCFCGCTQDVPVFTKLDNMAKADYTVVTMDISVVKTAVNEAVPLKSKIIFTYDGTGAISITYTVEEYQTIEVDGYDILLPDNQIVAKTGSAKIKDGEIFDQQGYVLSADLTKIAKLNFNFRSGNFTETKVKDDIFSARVKNIQGFLGNAVDCFYMTVSVDVAKLDGLTINYRTNQSDVTVTYTLTK